MPSEVLVVDTSDTTRNATNWTSYTRFLVPLLLAFSTGANLLFRCRAASSLAYYDDDCFYCLQIARNLARGRGSTFDGTDFTNGYHPLWMAVMVVLFKILPLQRMFLIGLGFLMVAGVMATYYFALQCLRRYAAPGVAVEIAAATLAIFSFLITSCGMEIVLTIPLLFAFADYRLRHFDWSPKSAFLLATIGAALVLSRLDSLFFLAILATTEVLFSAHISLAHRLRSAAAFVAALFQSPFISAGTASPTALRCLFQGMPSSYVTISGSKHLLSLSATCLSKYSCSCCSLCCWRWRLRSFYPSVMAGTGCSQVIERPCWRSSSSSPLTCCW